MPANETTKIDSDEAADVYDAIERLCDRLGIAHRLQHDTDTEYEEFVYELAGTVTRALESADPDDYGRNINQRWASVTKHPDYLFGTMFQRGDLGEDADPDEFPASVASGQLSELGNQIIAEET